MSQQSTIDIHDGNNSFPFHTLTNSEFETFLILLGVLQTDYPKAIWID